MRITDEAVEKAAKFVHERTKELAPTLGFPINDDYPSWDDMPEPVRVLAKQVIAELIGNLMIGYAATLHGGN